VELCLPVGYGISTTGQRGPALEWTGMESLVSYAVLALGSLLAVLNPFATVPPFLAMTESNTAAERREMAQNACLIAGSVLVVFALTGVRVLNFFGVTVPAFQVAGGLVLIRVAFELLQGGRALKVTREESVEGKEKDDISITPLAVPILCGPATITAGILVASEATTWFHTTILVAVIAAVYAGILWVLRLAADYLHRVGETAIKISSRLMGLILVSVAVQFVVDGVRAAELFSP
jgi:multiple antibiotic resistance protein